MINLTRFNKQKNKLQIILLNSLEIILFSNKKIKLLNITSFFTFINDIFNSNIFNLVFN